MPFETSNSYSNLKSKFDNVPDGLDPEIAMQVARGQGWGKEDQARYDEAIKKRGEAKGQAQQYINNKPQNQGQAQQYINNRPQNQGNVTTQGSVQEQQVNQDNDINSTVQGDNNYVSNTQDNSVRFFGGNTTNFTYNGSGDLTKDTPASAMTLAGIGSVQDSPADTARFLGKYSTLNSDAQKKFANSGMDVANKYISRAAQTNPIDYQALAKQNAQQIQSHYDRAEVQSNMFAGDKYNYKPPVFNMPDPLDPLTSNVGEIADKYSDKIEDDDD